MSVTQLGVETIIGGEIAVFVTAIVTHWGWRVGGIGAARRRSHDEILGVGDAKSDLAYQAYQTAETERKRTARQAAKDTKKVEAAR